MANKPPLELIITKTGETRAIHSDAIMPILQAIGKPVIKRASHVEPVTDLRPEARAWLKETRSGFAADRLAQAADSVVDDGIITHLNGVLQWYADLLPVDGPVLGPYDTKQAALDCEVAWLRCEGYPVCPTGDCSTAPEMPTSHDDSRNPRQ